MRTLSPQQRRLAWSLFLNILTRAPSALGLVLVLPLIRFSVGSEEFYRLLSLIAFGSALTFLFGGYNTIARRRIGMAHSQENRQAEADAFVSIIAINFCLLAAGMTIVVFSASSNEGQAADIVIPGIVLSSAFLNTLDNVRAAYNEHYVTAAIQIVLQTTLLTLAYTIPSSRSSLVLDAIYISGYAGLASAIAGAVMMLQRPYLFSGKAKDLGQTFRDGFFLSTSDGLMMAAMNLSVVMVGTSAAVVSSAWYATLVRVFQTLLAPVLLVVMPISSFIWLRWHEWSVQYQKRALKTVLIISAAYSILSGVGIVVANEVYVARVMKLAPEISQLNLVAVYAFLCSIVLYKSYTSVTFILFDRSVIPLAVTATALVCMSIGATQMPSGSVFSLLALCALVASIGILVAVAYDFSEKLIAKWE